MDATRFDRIARVFADRKLSRRQAITRGGAALAAGALVAGLGQTVRSQDATLQASPVPDLTGVSPLSLADERLVAFDAYVAAKLAELHIPGASVAVVQGGEVVFLNGYGARELGRPEPVTPDTLLRIGSVTKSFSALLTAAVVDAGRLRWETPLVELLPTFAVADPELTPLLTVADAFCACTGLPRRDFELIFNDRELTPELLVAGIAQLPLTASYGEKFQYSNQLVAAGGYAAAVANGGAPDGLGDAYAIALRERVLNPIGMPRSTLTLTDVLASGDYAAPHAEDIAGAVHRLPLMEDDSWIVPAAPAGALWSSAREMARYVQTQLGRGLNPDGARVVSAANLERTWQPGVALLPPPGTPPEVAALNEHYALGWVVGSYGKQRVIQHSGATYGFVSLVTFLPDADLGLVVLTNGPGMASGLLTVTVQFRLLELVFDRPTAFDAGLKPLLAVATEERADLLAQLDDVDLAAVAPYIGRYANPALGEFTLVLREGRLIFDAGELRSELRPRVDSAGATTDYRMVDPPMAFPQALTVTVADGPDGRPQAVLMVLAGNADADADLAYPYDFVEPLT